MVIKGGEAGVATGILIGATYSSGGTSTSAILASIFMRLCACAALAADALKRSTNFCMWARAASCFLANAMSWARLAARSEEHTSELQSHHDLVCRLLLEKKKKKHKRTQDLKKKKKTYHTEK